MSENARGQIIAQCNWLGMNTFVERKLSTRTHFDVLADVIGILCVIKNPEAHIVEWCCDERHSRKYDYVPRVANMCCLLRRVLQTSLFVVVTRSAQQRCSRGLQINGTR